MKIKVRPFIYSTVVFMLLIQVVLQTYIPVFQYLDELVAVLCFSYLFIVAINKEMSRDVFLDIIIMIILAVVGILGNVVSNLNINLAAIFYDFINIFKAYVAFLAAYIFFERSSQTFKRDVIEYLNLFCKILILPGFLLALVNLFIDIGMHTEYVYGIRAFHYIFYRVGNLNLLCYRCLIIMAVYLSELKEREKLTQNIYILMTIILMVSTLRARAFIYAFIFIFGYLYFVKGKIVKIKLRYIVLVAAVGLYIALPKLQYYFMNGDTARAVLLRFGFKTAVTYAPFGAGFGNYGTFSAIKYWSPLYDRYNFNGYYGLSRDYGAFATDNYWPAIMGEFGFIGVILVACLIVRIYIRVAKKTQGYMVSRFAALFGITSISIASLVSSSFFNTAVVSVMMLTALACTYKKDSTEIKG